MPRFRSLPLLALLLAVAPLVAAVPGDKEDSATAKGSPLATLPLRSIGPAITSGRVGDIAVDPRKTDTWFVAAASGGLWKTVNAGTTWKPIFDKEASFSIGCVTLDPRDASVVWVAVSYTHLTLPTKRIV